uniref:Programmed cell death protein 7 n=1 Tax=Glossina pallidipes TaxID=7398 RepID=A0A1A9ZUM8_GLOPL
MSSKIVNVSQVKEKLKSVIENLKYLESSEEDAKNLLPIQQKIFCMLNDVEALPLKAIKSRIEKRKKRRQKIKLKKQKIKFMNSELAKTAKPISSHNQEATLNEIEKHLITKKSYQQLKTIYEGQRFLKIFKLLENLHLSRGQNADETKKFAQKFQRLITVWKTFILEKQNYNETLENQWNTALFGSPSSHHHLDLENFLRRRTIWDSYISFKGSSIPPGWVLPPQHASNEWSAYLCSSYP